MAEPLGDSFWARYVAQRAAPLEDVPTAVVVAAFGGFAPDRIADARAGIAPDATPTTALETRLRGIDAAVAELPGLPDDAVVTEAADLAWTAAQACQDAGRVLGAANRAMPRPSTPHLALWQATTTLREHRGDGHLAALAVHGIGPVASHVLKVAAGESPARDLRLGRRIGDEAWDAAVARLADDGLLTPGHEDGGPTLTAAGAALHRAVEDATDRAAAGPWEALGPEHTDRLATLLEPIAAAARSVVPPVNPIGLPPREDAGAPGSR
ncbi:hypothetical protein LQ327_07810 [Actinomycetospora endophytica]|uniref:MarR family transcriptional regulator n=1 Tax=Actinomycetospora endophytica TaxID=2291215 RepID=A0ABS8P4V6_9PSEU|nr:hypothetical protein [Actinomycetospora endophytica]MCD2193290.1 hypothetical protein [Actinomycetospora endophytica]